MIEYEDIEEEADNLSQNEGNSEKFTEKEEITSSEESENPQPCSSNPIKNNITETPCILGETIKDKLRL